VRLCFGIRGFGVSVLITRRQCCKFGDIARSDLPIREGGLAEKAVGRTPERSGRAWTLRAEREKVLVE
jgi:hypothetical protein